MTDAATLLPHEGAARFLETVVAWTQTTLHGAGRVPAGTPYEAEGACSMVVCVELGAQAAAALEALQRRDAGGGAPREGYLVTIQEARFSAPSVLPGEPLDVAVRHLGTAGPLARYEAVVSRGGVECAAVSISTFLAGPAR